MATGLPDFPAFDLNCDATSLGITWKKWSSRLENLFVALDIKDETLNIGFLATIFQLL